MDNNLINENKLLKQYITELEEKLEKLEDIYFFANVVGI